MRISRDQFSPGVKTKVVIVAAETKSYARAAVVLEKVGEVRVSDRHIGRVAQVNGQRLVDQLHEQAELLKQKKLSIEVENIPELAVVGYSVACVVEFWMMNSAKYKPYCSSPTPHLKSPAHPFVDFLLSHWLSYVSMAFQYCWRLNPDPMFHLFHSRTSQVNTSRRFQNATSMYVGTWELGRSREVSSITTQEMMRLG